MNLSRLFPDLKDTKWGRVSLNQWAEHLMKEGEVAPFQKGKSILLDPKKCTKFVGLVHKRLGVEVSYGGFMEDRSILWRGSYMAKDNRCKPLRS